jgi:hypothetical protein
MQLIGSPRRRLLLKHARLLSREQGEESRESNELIYSYLVPSG